MIPEIYWVGSAPTTSPCDHGAQKNPVRPTGGGACAAHPARAEPPGLGGAGACAGRRSA